jgi:PAS domain S-box-containing protein
MQSLQKTINQLILDIKGLKRQVKALERRLRSSNSDDTSQQQKQYIFDNINDIAWFKDKHSRYIFANKAFEKMCGMKSDNLFGKTDFDIWPKHLAEKYITDDKEVISEKRNIFIEETLIDKRGRLHYFETTKAPFCSKGGKVLGIIGIAHNITNRKRNEEELRKLNVLLDSIIENIPNMVFLKDAKELRFVRFNRAGEKLLGYRRSELLGKNDYDFFPKKQAEFFIRKDRQVLESKGILDIPEESIKTRNKGIRLLHTKKVTILNNKGKPEYLLGISDDITEYKKAYVKITELEKAKTALAESEKQYRTLFTLANDAIFLADAETGLIVDVNIKATELVARPRKEILGMHYSELHPEEDKEIYKNIFLNCKKAKKISTQSLFVVDKKGKYIPVQISVTSLRLKGKLYLLGIFSDITELKAIEERLKKDKGSLESIVAQKREDLSAALKNLEEAKRLADIGSLAAMIAHELRNPLGVIKTAAYNIKQKMKTLDTKDIKSHIDNINKKITESDNIINNLLGYSKTLTPVYKRVSISRIINDCTDFMEQKYNKPMLKLTVDIGFAKDMFVRADKIQITSLLCNVLDNAYQAFDTDKGEIKLTCRLIKKAEAIRIIVKDNGAGLSKGNLVRVFEPFFSLKAKGVGLGLAVCKQIVSLHGGHIDIKSKITKGTTVTITLPVCAKQPF